MEAGKKFIYISCHKNKDTQLREPTSLLLGPRDGKNWPPTVNKSARLRPQCVRTYSLTLICFYMLCPRNCTPFPPNLFLDVKIG